MDEGISGVQLPRASTIAHDEFSKLKIHKMCILPIVSQA